MFIRDEDAQALTRLGFTCSQAKVYLALIALRKASGKTLWKQSGVGRQDIYRVLNELMEKGLVEKAITSEPTEYRPIAMEDALKILLLRKEKEYKETEEKTKNLFHRLINNNSEKWLHEENAEFIIIPGKEIIIQRLKDALDKAQISLNVVTSKRRFSLAMVELSEGYEKALQRGVTIHIAVETHVPEKEALEVAYKLMNAWKTFEVRYFSSPPEAIVAIFDGKQASVTLSAAAHLNEASALWSNNSSFIALAQNYFESKWKTSSNDNGSVTMLCVGCPCWSLETCNIRANCVPSVQRSYESTEEEINRVSGQST